MERYTIAKFNDQFPDEGACLDLVLGMVYPEGVTCRQCGIITKHHKLASRKAYSCDQCGTHVYPLAGTIFEKSSTSLKSWFYAIYLMASTRCGISAKHLERELGVTYKTAWRMFKQVRSLFDEDITALDGTVEIDETFVGGRPRYRNGQQPPKDEYGRTRRGPRPASHPTQKVTVVGAVERKGRIRARVLGSAVAPSMDNVMPLIGDHVLPSAMIYTDEARHYGTLRAHGYDHKRVHHAAKVYVDGDVHTNTIEGFWSLLKRSIGGAHHAVSAKYLPTYLNEYAFRYNHRDDSDPMFVTMLGRVTKVRGGQYGEYAPVG